MRLTTKILNEFHANGFVVIPKVLSTTVIDELHHRFADLFNGTFETGIYPDEWHWRQGISFPDATKEICNGWKSDRYIASVVCSEKLGKMACELMNWKGSRLAQDDVIWKPAGGSEIGYHQDSSYISTQFEPKQHNSVTIWCALDDATDETGCIEYVRGSHQWNVDFKSLDFHTKQSYHAPVYKAAALASVKEPLDIVKVEVPKGACVIHHQDTWHGSGPNRHVNQPRRALVAHLLRQDVLFQAGDTFHLDSTAPSYIYGRYKRMGDVKVDETFFPITYSKTGYRTAFLEKYLLHLPEL